VTESKQTNAVTLHPNQKIAQVDSPNRTPLPGSRNTDIADIRTCVRRGRVWPVQSAWATSYNRTRGTAGLWGYRQSGPLWD